MNYDAAGRRESLIDAKAHRTTFTYDEVGNITKERDALGRVTTYSYTADQPAGIEAGRSGRPLAPIATTRSGG